jgi:hypothetical protein
MKYMGINDPLTPSMDKATNETSEGRLLLKKKQDVRVTIFSL